MKPYNDCYYYIFGLTHCNSMLDTGVIEDLQRMTHEDYKISSYLKGVRDRLILGEKYSMSKLEVFDELMTTLLDRCFEAD